MSTIFDDLASALAPYVGGTAAAGVILSFAFIFTVFICVELFLSTTRKGRSSIGMDDMMVSVVIGFTFSGVVGWLPVWIFFFVFGAIMWMVLDPMGAKKTNAG